MRKTCVGVLLMSASLVAGAAQMDVATGIQLAQIDFDLYHAALLDRCQSIAPESAGALAASMAQWKAQNADALVILRQLYKAQLARNIRALQPALSDAEADAQVAAVLELYTSGLKEKVSQVPDDEARTSCNGGYAAQTLARPDMDFNALLTRMTLGTGGR
jgi:hypothetical protein